MTALPSPLRERLEHVHTCSAHPWVRALAQATAAATGPRTLGQLIPLLLLADPKSGRVFLQRSALAALWSVEEGQVEPALRDLERGGHLHLRTPGPYLVLFLRMWPRRSPSQDSHDPRNTPISGGDPSGAVPAPPSAPPPSALPLPLGENTRSAPLVGSEGKGNGGRDGGEVRGPGRGEEGWTDRFVQNLVTRLDCPQDRDQLRALCARTPREVLERALDRTIERPRRNPAAYFTKLVGLLQRERP